MPGFHHKCVAMYVVATYMEVSLSIINSGYLVHGLMEKHFITVFV